MKSIKSFVSEAIEGLRHKIAVWDNSNSSSAEKAEVVKAILANDQEFWQEVAKRATVPAKVKKVKTISPVEVVMAEAVTAKPTSLAAAPAPKPMPAKPVKATAPARTLKLSTGGSDFAAKINGAAKEVGLADRSVIGQFRSVLGDQNGRGTEYWDKARDVTEDALRGAELLDADWDILIAVMKRNLFFTGKKGGLFIERCSKEKLLHLLLDQDGLTGLVAQIKMEEEFNPSSIYRIGFVFDSCLRVGREAKALRINCAHVVNRMRQKGWLPDDHWLVGKVADAKATRATIPPEKFAEATSDETASLVN